jgi:predicted NUDIX family phosphoesterase
MEQDPSFKQLIPYCLIQHTDDEGETHLFQYTRGGGMGEARLHAKKSVGIGGHISTLDESAECVYGQGMQRELDEEIVIRSPFESECVGMINDDENAVGKVHLGVVHIINVEQPDVRANEDDIEDSGFLPLAEILSDIERYETWSQICLRALFG